MKMQDAELQKLIETSWRRSLNADELRRLSQALTAAPSSQALWEQEIALNRLLQKMPAAPVSSNFTARVLNAARTARSERAVGRPILWLPVGWLPRLALVMAMIGCGSFSFREYQIMHRAQVAREVARAMPPVGWLKDFDTINRLNKVKVADDDLLTTLE